MNQVGIGVMVGATPQEMLLAIFKLWRLRGNQ